MQETYELEWVNCGKGACRSCPHGPYWYAYRTERGKRIRRYIGRVLPPEDQAKVQRIRRWKKLNATRWIEDNELPDLPRRQM